MLVPLSELWSKNNKGKIIKINTVHTNTDWIMIYTYTFALSNTISYNKIEPFLLINRKNNILCVFWRYGHPSHRDNCISQSTSYNLILLRLREGHLLMSLHVKQWTVGLGSALTLWTTRDNGLHGLFKSSEISTEHLPHPLPWPPPPPQL